MTNKLKKYTNGKIYDPKHKEEAKQIWLKNHVYPYLFGPKMNDRMFPAIPAQSSLDYGIYTFEIFEIECSEFDLGNLKIHNMTNQKCVRFYLNN